MKWPFGFYSCMGTISRAQGKRTIQFCTYSKSTTAPSMACDSHRMPLRGLKNAAFFELKTITDKVADGDVLFLWFCSSN